MLSAILCAVLFTAPPTTLHDAVPQIRVTGLTPGAAYVMTAQGASRAGTVWRSSARFVADAKGAVDPSAQATVSGTYEGVDPIGLFWSMEKKDERETDASLLASDDQDVVRFELKDEAGTVLAKHRLTLQYRAYGVSTTEIRERDVTGTFFAPFGAQRRPAILLLGGSEGGLHPARGALLASHGYAVLVLAYFGIGALPQQLDRIPLETIDRGLAWLRAQPVVDAKRVAIMGGSKGAELALLMATRTEGLAAVIALAPSSHVFQNITYGQGPKASSWTIGGKDVPFAPYMPSSDPNGPLVHLYKATLSAAPPESEIAVEKIRAPILLIAGKDDLLWPSAEMSERIQARLARHARPSAQLALFDAAGHQVSRSPLSPTADAVRLGGTARGNAHGQLQAWKTIVEFLDRAMKK